MHLPRPHSQEVAQACGLQTCPLAKTPGWSLGTVGAMEGSGSGRFMPRSSLPTQAGPCQVALAGVANDTIQRRTTRMNSKMPCYPPFLVWVLNVKTQVPQIGSTWARGPRDSGPIASTWSCRPRLPEPVLTCTWFQTPERLWRCRRGPGPLQEGRATGWSEQAQAQGRQVWSKPQPQLLWSATV